MAERTRHWQGVRRLLAVRLDNLGDVLMTTPALAALRHGLPQAQITLLASPAGALAAPHLPMVDAVWPFAAPWMQRGGGHEAAGIGQAEAALVSRLREACFDAAVIFTVCTQSALPAALLCRLAGIPLRLAHCRENPYALLSDWVLDADQLQAGMRHEVQRQLDLMASVGLHPAEPHPPLRFAVHDADRTRVAARLAACLAAAGVAPHTPYAVLHPGATAASRRWPAARFGVAADAIAAQGLATVFTGDHNDLPLVALARQAMARPSASLAGALSLGELAALIESAAVLVANNSAPAHLAAALGTPVVALYALTNPQHTPWQVPARVLSHDVPCRWCCKSVCPQLHHDCLGRVQPAQVADAALQLLRPAAIRPPTDLPAAAVLESRP